MIVGTAGHIDHGKTTLVRALTGVDTDRLKEEKERGISIELGYAYTPLAGDDVLGFIDVPGHERLVHTMVAGACGIDFALLVVAADDGVMPQTREHLAILELLGVTRGAVALTKVDRVDDARRQEAETEVAALLATTPLRGAPIFAVDATAPADRGTAELRRHLCEAAARLPARSDDALFRLAVDRVFTLAGHGVIATGTVFSGRLRTGDTLAVMPSGLTARVRGIHAQNRGAESGRAGQRCAVNLAGVEKSALARGDWLAHPGLLAPTRRVDARLRLLGEGPSRLVPWSPVHVHLGTTHQVAHVVPLESAHVSAGESARVQLVFDTPVCALTGDRFVVRDSQAARTIGGGVVLDPLAPSRRRRSPERVRRFDAIEQWLAEHRLEPLLRQARLGLAMSELVRTTGLAPGRIALPAGTRLVDAGGEQYAFDPAGWSALRERSLAVLREFHERTPDEAGADSGRLRRMTSPNLPLGPWQALVDELVRDQLLDRSGPWLHLPDHKVRLNPEDEALARVLQPLVAEGRYDPPWVRELASRVQAPEERVRQVLRKQVKQGAVYQVVHDLFYDGGRVAELAAVAARLAQEHDGVDAARYRDALGLGRKRAIQILEFFDRVGFTRRVRDTHLLRVDSGWRVTPS